MTRNGSIFLSVAIVALLFLVMMLITRRPVAKVDPGAARSAEVLPDSAPHTMGPLQGERVAATGPTTIAASPVAAGAAITPDRLDPVNFDYPARAGQLEKLGEFEELETKVFRHPDGSLRVHRLLRTEMKYPLVLAEEVFSGASGTLAKQTLSVGDHLMVQFVSSAGRADIEGAVREAGFTVRKWFQQPGLVLLGIPDADLDSLDESLAVISALPMIEFAERDEIVFAE